MRCSMEDLGDASVCGGCRAESLGGCRRRRWEGVVGVCDAIETCHLMEDVGDALLDVGVRDAMEEVVDVTRWRMLETCRSMWV